MEISHPPLCNSEVGCCCGYVTSMLFICSAQWGTVINGEEKCTYARSVLMMAQSPTHTCTYTFCYCIHSDKSEKYSFYKHHGRVSQKREGKRARGSDGWLRESKVGTSKQVRVGLYSDAEGEGNKREMVEEEQRGKDLVCIWAHVCMCCLFCFCVSLCFTIL